LLPSPVGKEALQNQQKLQQVLAAPNPDPATVGQLVIAIAALGLQVQQIAGSFQQQASNLPQADQKTKLPPLQLLLELHPAHDRAPRHGMKLPSWLNMGKLVAADLLNPRLDCALSRPHQAPPAPATRMARSFRK
jgi:hypothetical protein